MRTDLEDLDDLLPALRDSAGADPQAPTEVYRRLKFLARVLSAAETGEGNASDASGPRLLWLDERGEVRSLPVSGGGVVIGRDPACDVVLAGPRVSRRHCVVRAGAAGEVRVEGASGAEIEDLGSSNGTVVNGAPIGDGARGLRDGYVIEVGGVALAVVNMRNVHRHA